MGRIIEWAKDHKGLAIALGIGIVILIYLYTRRSSSSASQAQVGSTGLSEGGYLSLNQSELAAATQVQGQQIAATVATQQLTDQLQAKQLDDSTQLAIAKLQSDLQSGSIYSQTQLGQQQITAQENVALATIQADQATRADQLALDEALINVIAGTGRNNVLNPVAGQPITPVIVSSNPNQGIFVATDPIPAQTAPNSAPSPSQTSGGYSTSTLEEALAAEWGRPFASVQQECGTGNCSGYFSTVAQQIHSGVFTQDPTGAFHINRAA